MGTSYQLGHTRLEIMIITGKQSYKPAEKWQRHQPPPIWFLVDPAV